jgi:hypothetical protein
LQIGNCPNDSTTTTTDAGNGQEGVFRVIGIVRLLSAEPKRRQNFDAPPDFPMRLIAITATVALLTACASMRKDGLGYVPERGYESYQRDEYLKGLERAKLDLRQGVLGFEDIECEEEEGWRVLWCYRKLLREPYGIDYRVISPSPVPGPVARIAGYQKVVRPIIEARLGADWEERIYEEAKRFYREHWSEVEHLYLRERWTAG